MSRVQVAGSQVLLSCECDDANRTTREKACCVQSLGSGRYSYLCTSPTPRETRIARMDQVGSSDIYHAVMQFGFQRWLAWWKYCAAHQQTMSCFFIRCSIWRRILTVYKAFTQSCFHVQIDGIPYLWFFSRRSTDRVFQQCREHVGRRFATNRNITLSLPSPSATSSTAQRYCRIKQTPSS